MKRKKILWVSHFLPIPPKGGAQIRSFNLIKELSAFHDVSLFCLVQEELALNYFDSLEVAIEEAREIFGSICSEVKFIPLGKKGKNVKMMNLMRSIFSLNSYSAVSLNVKKIKPELADFINDIDFEFVHIDTVSLILFNDLFKNKKLVVNHHNIESLMMARRAKEHKNIFFKAVCYLDSLKIRNIEKIAAANGAVHLVCSDLDASRLTGMYPAVSAAIIPNGIDCESASTIRNSDGVSLLFIGGLDWYPNADAVKFILNDIYPCLVEKIPEIRLDIIGKNPSFEISQQAEKFSNVKVHGFVNDISVFYENAWLYICPIKDGGGTKLKVLDAMANCVPLIAHPVAMEGIDAISGVHYFQASTAQDFVNLIIDIYSKSPDVLNEVGMNGNKLIFSKYDYKGIGKKLAHIYDDVMVN